MNMFSVINRSPMTTQQNPAKAPERRQQKNRTLVDIHYLGRKRRRHPRPVPPAITHAQAVRIAAQPRAMTSEMSRTHKQSVADGPTNQKQIQIPCALTAPLPSASPLPPSSAATAPPPVQHLTVNNAEQQQVFDNEPSQHRRTSKGI